MLENLSYQERMIIKEALRDKEEKDIKDKLREKEQRWDLAEGVFSEPSEISRIGSVYWGIELECNQEYGLIRKKLGLTEHEVIREEGDIFLKNRSLSRKIRVVDLDKELSS